MKVLIEEIVMHNPDGAVGTRYRRASFGVLDAPEELITALSEGHELIVTGGYRQDDDTRRALMIADVRIGMLNHHEHVGVLLDVISPELYKALADDESMPADYAAFCKLEGIEP